MKKIFSIFALAILGFSLFSQNATNSTFQIVALDDQNQPMINCELIVKATILKTAPTGESEYQEQFILKTDSLGLLKIRFGDGVNNFGKFTQTMLKDGTYFVNLEIRKNGESTFKDILTCQFIPETLSLSNISATEQKKRFIGEKFGGGIVFFIDETGEHGLIVAPTDQGNNIPFGCKRKTIGASDLTNGLSNTQKIVEQCKENSAAAVCRALKLDGFSDWYLPSQYELRLLFDQRAKIPGLSAGNYCSSSEYYAPGKSWNGKVYDCWVIQFGREGKLIHYHKETGYFVRAIRKF